MRVRESRNPPPPLIPSVGAAEGSADSDSGSSDLDDRGECDQGRGGDMSPTSEEEEEEEDVSAESEEEVVEKEEESGAADDDSSYVASQDARAGEERSRSPGGGLGASTERNGRREKKRAPKAARLSGPREPGTKADASLRSGPVGAPASPAAPSLGPGDGRPVRSALTNAIISCIDGLKMACVEFSHTSQAGDVPSASAATKSFAKVAVEYRRLAVIRSELEGGGPGSFEAAMNEAEVGSTNFGALAVSLNFAFELNARASLPPGGAERARMLCTCLRFFAGAEDLVGFFKVISGRGKASPKALLKVLSDPDIVGQLLRAIEPGEGGRAEKNARVVAGNLAQACLALADPRRFVEMRLLSDENDFESDAALSSLLKVASSLHKMDSYSAKELVLLFLVRVRRRLSLIAASKTRDAAHRRTAELQLHWFDSSFPMRIREKLSQMNLQFPAARSDARFGRERETQFRSWSRLCLTEMTQQVVSFECIGVYRYVPMSDSLGTRIREVPFVDVNDDNLSFFVVRSGVGERDMLDCASSTECGSHEDKKSWFPSGDFSAENVYGGLELVQVSFKDWVERVGDQPTEQPIVYCNEDDCSISIRLSPEGRIKSHFVDILPNADSFEGLSVDDSKDKSGFHKADESFSRDLSSPMDDHAELYIMIKREQFHSFCAVLNGRGIGIVNAATTSDAHQGVSLQHQGEALSMDQKLRDHTAIELTTRRVRSAPRIQTLPGALRECSSSHSNVIFKEGAVSEKRPCFSVVEGNEMKESSSISNADSLIPTQRTQIDSDDYQKAEVRKRKSQLRGSIECSVPLPVGGYDDLFPSGKRAKFVSAPEKSREVTPVAPTTDHSLAQTFTTKLVDGDDGHLSQILDTKFSSVDQSGVTLASISAHCFASVMCRGRPSIVGSGIQFDLPLPMGKLLQHNETAERVVAMDKALVRAVDALSEVKSLSNNMLEGIIGSTAGDANKSKPQLSPLEWIGKTYDTLSSGHRKWMSQRKEVEQQLHGILLQQLTSTEMQRRVSKEGGGVSDQVERMNR